MPTLPVTEQGARLEIEVGRLVVAAPDDEVLFSAPANTRLVRGHRRERRHHHPGDAVAPGPHEIDLVFLSRSGAYRGRLLAGLEERRAAEIAGASL
ncbi:MAG: hypothetical protein R3A46_15085 [Thermomicrobiales bacterium]